MENDPLHLTLEKEHFTLIFVIFIGFDLVYSFLFYGVRKDHEFYSYLYSGILSGIILTVLVAKLYYFTYS